MKRSVITVAALAALAAATFAGVQATVEGSRTVCLPAAVVQAWS
jgi:hypothetical protein